MSIKFYRGIGRIDNPLSVDSKETTATVDGKQIVVDHTVPKLGNIGPVVVGTSFQAPAPAPKIGDPARIFDVSSQDSGPAPYETIFHDFDLEATPVYNFWTEDEETDDSSLRGDRELTDIPRYVRLTWRKAPVLIDPIKKLPTDFSKQFSRTPVKFGVETDQKPSFYSNGMVFQVAHVSDFDAALGSLANGYLAPGVIESVVELPARSSGLVEEPPELDEDVFLSDQTTAGLSLHELACEDTTRSYPEASDDHVVSVRDGELRLVTLSSGSPSISILARIAVPSETPSPDHVETLLAKTADIGNVLPSPISAVKVKFVDPAVDGVISEDKVMAASKPEHVENIVTLGQYLPNLDIMGRTKLRDRLSLSAPALPAPDMPQLEYIGYVIEKYRREDSGVYRLVDTFKLDSREYDEYIDCAVAYGCIYRYRIRAVIRWTRDKDIGVEGKLSSIGILPASPTRSVASKQSTYVAGEWSKGWAYSAVLDTSPPSPPDELTVRPISAKKKIVVTLKLPYNPQRDILLTRLFRKLQDRAGNDVTGWSQVGPDFPPGNVLFEDTGLVPFQENGIRYVYAAQTISRHAEESVLSEQLSARINGDFKSSGEYPVEQVSCLGVPLGKNGSFSRIPFMLSREEVVFGQTMKVGGREAIGNSAVNPENFVLRVQSLDTGEKYDIPVNTTFNTQPPAVRRDSLGVYIDPSAPLPDPKQGIVSQNRTPNISRELTGQDAPTQKISSTRTISGPGRLG